MAHTGNQTANGLLNTERVSLLRPTTAGGATQSAYSLSSIGQTSFAAAGLDTFDPTFAALLTLDSHQGTRPAAGAGPSSSGGGTPAASASAGVGPTQAAFALSTPAPAAPANTTAAQDALFAAASTPTTPTPVNADLLAGQSTAGNSATPLALAAPLPDNAITPVATTTTTPAAGKRRTTLPPPAQTWSTTPPRGGVRSFTPLTSPPEDGGPPLGGIDTVSLPPSLEINPAVNHLDPAANAFAPQLAPVSTDNFGGYEAGLPQFSTNPVRYADGAVNLTFSDLSSYGFGTPWGQTRNWTNVLGYARASYNGTGMVDSQLPVLLPTATGVAVVTNGTTARYFDLVSGAYVPRYFDDARLVAVSASKQFVLYDPQGDVLTFDNYDASLPTLQQGHLESWADAAGNLTSVTSHNSDGQVTEVQRSSTVNGTTITESYWTTYLGSTDANGGLESNVTLRRKVDSGSWTTVRQVAYAYYDGTTSYGNLGDLKTSVVEDASSTALDTTYYRYYTQADLTGGANGYLHGLKYVFTPASYGRLTTALGSTAPTSATDTQVAPYADDYFEYDSTRRVTKVTDAGAGGDATSGLGTSTFTYTANTHPSGTPGPNEWATKTVETLPDGNENIVYTNTGGVEMLKDYYDVYGSSSHWLTYAQYDSAGRQVVLASPSAVTGYSDTYNDLLHYQTGTGYQYLSSTAGEILTTTFGTTTTATSTTAGDAVGYVKNHEVQQGQSGTAILLDATQYISNTDANSTTSFFAATATVYRNTDGTGGETTTDSYTFATGTNQVQAMAVSLPTVSSTQNGPGTADTTTTVYDGNVRPNWIKDADGFIHYVAYDQATGAVVQTIVDFQTSPGVDGYSPPSGWSTPTGGGPALLTQIVVDALGRPTKTTDPLGNITYQTYNDANDESRVYAGWNGTTSTPTLPTQLLREDRAGGYVESLTMTATPHLTSSVPDGTESVGSLQTLARSYTNAVGQVANSDAYFNLSGLTYATSTHIGTLNTNYYEAADGYDSRGRMNRVLSPTGTINRTVYDGLGRAVSTWVGINDTPTSGSWSPTNNTSPSNMVQLTANVYDASGVGDGNLTQTTSYPGLSATARVTNNWYDWRDRLVASKSGVQTTEDTTTHRPITYATYDNLGEVTQVQKYDGDGVTVSTSGGVPVAPSSSLLRAQTTIAYDDQQRVYRQQTYLVNPTTGSVSTNALATNAWYNHRGATIKTAAVGGLVTKNQYDGAGRVTVSYATDGLGDSSWTNAGSVTGNNVLAQTEMIYDADGNVIETKQRDRFHDETTTGALGNPTTGPKARLSYDATYYDAANRSVGTDNVGTNGGVAWTRPGTFTSSTGAELTSSIYNAAGWLETLTDARSLVTKAYYDALGRTTKTIEAYNGGTQTGTTNKTTEFTYDGDGNQLTYQADQVGGGYQRTQFVYGVTTAGGSAINSNDVLAAVKHPDKSTGSPSSSEQDTYTVNALGQVITATDRNGTVHTYTYDVLGRQTVDAVTTLGSGVDGAVRRIETAYDTQGNAYLVTSYDASTGGSIVNQIQRTYNGLGQLTAEYQSHSGAVNTSTTLKVQYAYSEMASGANHSRLVSMTYPNGRVLNYNYATGVDDRISRLTSLSDSTGTLESYSYLGLSTVVRRAHPQPGVDLTYIKQSGESNGDAGDQYTGLDRLGRVVDQRWLSTSTGTAVDRFDYGYDAGNNRLYRANLVNTSFSELYHANGSSNGYDNLNQLKVFARGTLNGPKDSIPTPAHSQTWTTDGLGNFTTVNTDGTNATNTFNAQNEISTTGVAYDANGNLTADGTGKTYAYDAWNRMVQVKSGSTTLASYSYDGMSRRVVENSGTAKDIYFSSAWQVLEERVGGVAKAQYVWSAAGGDVLVERDRDPNNGGTLSERLYVLQDANWNVSALVDTSGTVVERYVYDPYGSATVLNATWAPISVSAYAWVYLHQGGRFDPATGLYNFRNRDLSPAQGRWMQTDPKGFAAHDQNLYRYEGNTATARLDPSGLDWSWSWSGCAGGALSGGLVGAGTGALVGTFVFPVVGTGIGAGAGAIAGAGLGCLAGGGLAHGILTEWLGVDNPTGWQLFGVGVGVGIPAGVVGGFVGPLGYALLTVGPAATWASFQGPAAANWLGIGVTAATAESTQAPNQVQQIQQLQQEATQLANTIQQQRALLAQLNEEYQLLQSGESGIDPNLAATGPGPMQPGVFDMLAGEIANVERALAQNQTLLDQILNLLHPPQQ